MAHLTLDPRCLARAWSTQSMANKGETKCALCAGLGADMTRRMAALPCHQNSVLKPSRVSQPLQDRVLGALSLIHFCIHSTNSTEPLFWARYCAHLCPNKVPILENMHPTWSIREGEKLPGYRGAHSIGVKAMALGPNTHSTYSLGDLDLPVPQLPHTCNGDSNSVTAVTVKMT